MTKLGEEERRRIGGERVGRVVGVNVIFYLGPEARDAHSEQGWFWLVCASPVGAL